MTEKSEEEEEDEEQEGKGKGEEKEEVIAGHHNMHFVKIVTHKMAVGASPWS